MPLYIHVEQARIRQFAASPGGPVFRHWVRIMAKIDAVAKRKLSNDMVNVRTGNLRSSQQIPTVLVLGNRIVGSAVNVAKYALAVHEGTRPHLIEPRNASILTGWSYEGAPVFTRIVNHRGTKGRPWLRDAVREVIATT